MVLSGVGYLGIDNKHLRVEEHPDGAIRGWGVYLEVVVG